MKKAPENEEPRTEKSRRAFTLVELLVAMALIVFIMSILAECFAAGLDTFRQLKAIGDMQEKLRSATNILRSDLLQDHYTGKIRISDPHVNFTSLPNIPLSPREGFFEIGKGVSNPDGTDADGIPSFTSRGYFLWFTSKLRGNRRENFFSFPVPGGGAALNSVQTNFFNQPRDAVYLDPAYAADTFHTQWAEIKYFTTRTGTILEPANATSTIGTPLFALYRSQLGIVPDPDALNQLKIPWQANPAANPFWNLCCVPVPDPATNTLVTRFSSPSDVRIAAPGPTQAAVYPFRASDTPAGAGRGATLLCTNVISFELKLMPRNGTDFMDLISGPQGQQWQPGQSFEMPMRALQITLRVWDIRTQQTRQITIIQDM
ncbi:MAG: prepilin-type N-terminal cleavage/methylation domain-containing protein [Gemmataceae bacterium]|nr:prepilin-type N-terminal cleavage/methylation domain-containing protein [Gemmataceae bacterium]